MCKCTNNTGVYGFSKKKNDQNYNFSSKIVNFCIAVVNLQFMRQKRLLKYIEIPFFILSLRTLITKARHMLAANSIWKSFLKYE